MTQSPLPPPFGHAPAGIVTVMPPPAVVIVVGLSACVFFSTYGCAAGGVPAGCTVTWRRNGVVLPVPSTSVPPSACGPRPRAPRLKTACAPVMTGAGAGFPSMVGFVIAESGSFARRSMESAAATTEPSAGVEETTDGGLLSTVTLPRTLVAELPSES